MEKIIKIEGMSCQHCSARVTKAIETLGFKCEVDLAKGEAKVIGDSLDDKVLKETIEDLGFTVK